MILSYAGQEFNVIMVDSCEEARREIALLPKTCNYAQFDVETDGLHLTQSRAFYGAICYHRTVYLFPINEQVKLHGLKELANELKYLFAHNVLYEMNITANEMGEDYVLQMHDKWHDTMAIIRLTVEAKSVNDGGQPLKLKDFAKRNIDKNAGQYETLLKEYRKKQKRLQKREIGYHEVPHEILMPYLATDVILCQLLVESRAGLIAQYKQVDVFDREQKALKPAFKMQRTGLKVDREYLKESQTKVEAYTSELYERLHALTEEMAGMTFDVGQHPTIKKFYTKVLGYVPASTDKYFIRDRLKENDPVAKLIGSLRTLEKWNSTYITKLLRDSEYDGRIHPSLNPFQTITGRYSSDFQQMPKKALKTLEGEELFFPRRAIVSEPEESMYLFSLDFSQEELRYQAHYTLPLGGDINLLRAYMPFRCVHYKTKEPYLYKTKEQRLRWLEMRHDAPVGYWEDLLAEDWSVWVIPETGAYWKPTDIHGSTTSEALKILGIDKSSLSKKEWAEWRGIGKGYNFMKIYGGSPAKTAEVLDIDVEVAQAMDNGFLESFPLVRDYMRKIQQGFVLHGYVTNMFGRRYYLTSHREYYKGANYVIQGGCGDLLKDVMIKINNILEQGDYKTRIVLPVHDELIFRVHVTELHLIDTFIDIMQTCEKLLVPLLTEPDIILDNWSEKTAYTSDVAKQLEEDYHEQDAKSKTA